MSEEKNGTDAETSGEQKKDTDAGSEKTAEEEREEPSEEGGSPSEEGEDPSASPGGRAKIELAKKDAEIADLTDRYKRTMAEYENYRKRTEKEKEDIYSFAVRDVCSKLLPVLDNLERGVASVPEESKEDPIAQGMDKICKQFIKALSDAGIEPIEAVGKPFDTNFHNAVMHVDDDSLGENTVAEEFQKGYTYRGTVIRHSMVKVAN
ncbi:MAG: nucleotide exchange factor GrpE [Lachnospiraceae bacterium]|nr:nucleotide exchange factor GrpE [Lachnospiraceae bacterium]